MIIFIYILNTTQSIKQWATLIYFFFPYIPSQIRPEKGEEKSQG